MIWEAILGWIVARLEAFGAWLGGIVPPVPGWVTSAGAAISDVGGWVGWLGAWVPWPLVVAVLLVVGIVTVAAFAIRLVRIVASFMTLGGGA